MISVSQAISPLSKRMRERGSGRGRRRKGVGRGAEKRGIEGQKGRRGRS